MAPMRQKNRNYRRQPPPDSSPEASDHGCQLPTSPSPPPPVISVSLSCSGAAPFVTPLPSYSGDTGFYDNFSAAPGGGIGDGNEERQGKVNGRRGGGDRESSQSLAGPLDNFQNGAVESRDPSTEKGGSQTGVRRIASGVGYNMLKSMGWKENTGLGQSSNGIVDPILAKPKPNHLGIGFNPTAAHDAAQEKIRQIQEAKREERDQTLQLRLENAQKAEEEAIFMRESYVAVPSTSHEHLLGLGGELQENYLKHVASGQGHKSTEPGQCPRCRQRFDTKHALKSHINARHANALLAAKRQFKKERKRGGHQHGGDGTSRRSGKTRSARSLAPMHQDFSVYD